MEIIGQIAVIAIYSIKPGFSSDPLAMLRSPVLWGIAGIWLGVSLFFRGFPFLKRKRLIQNIPASTVPGASLGAVEVSGRVVGPYTLIASLSESDCFYYHAVARGIYGEEGHMNVKEETLYAPFFLDDGTGRLMVARAAQRWNFPRLWKRNILLRRASPSLVIFSAATAFPAQTRPTSKSTASGRETTCSFWERCEKIRE